MIDIEDKKTSVAERNILLPIFAYGTLQGEGMLTNTKNQALLLGRFSVRGVLIGKGDRYPCADITFNMSNVAFGDSLELCDKSQDTIDRVDKYEGVDDGYYQRRIIFASPEGHYDLFVPMWIYVRGRKLGRG